MSIVAVSPGSTDNDHPGMIMLTNAYGHDTVFPSAVVDWSDRAAEMMSDEINREVLEAMYR